MSILLDVYIKSYTISIVREKNTENCICNSQVNLYSVKKKKKKVFCQNIILPTCLFFLSTETRYLQLSEY